MNRFLLILEKMKKILLLTIIICISLTGYAQDELNTKYKQIPPKEAEAKKIEPPPKEIELKIKVLFENF